MKEEEIRKLLKRLANQLGHVNPRLRSWLDKQRKLYDGLVCEVGKIRFAEQIDGYVLIESLCRSVLQYLLIILSQSVLINLQQSYCHWYTPEEYAKHPATAAIVSSIDPKSSTATNAFRLRVYIPLYDRKYVLYYMQNLLPLEVLYPLSEHCNKMDFSGFLITCAKYYNFLILIVLNTPYSFFILMSTVSLLILSLQLIRSLIAP